jgi:NTE family protein
MGEPLTRQDPRAGYRFAAINDAKPRDDMLFSLTFSGGGKRAAALSYGVLQQLAADRAAQSAGAPRILDRVDLLSAVSGGSVTAAYYALYGDRIFSDFRQKFLERDVAADLRRQFYAPYNWWRLASSKFSSGDLLAEYLGRRLFGKATFADLASAVKRPYLILNASDLSAGARFEFTQGQFDLLCDNLDSYPLARAVAASAAFPVYVSPIVIANRAGSCGYAGPPWLSQAKQSTDLRRRQLASNALAYLDPSNIAYLHLADGALTDNLGVQAILDALLADGGAGPLAQRVHLHGVRRVVALMVNAAGKLNADIGRRRDGPSLARLVSIVGALPVDRYARELRTQYFATLRAASADMAESERSSVDFYGIEISLDDIDDPILRRDLQSTPTAVTLPRQKVDKLICAARSLLAASTEYRRLLQDLGAPPPDQSACP